MTKAAYPSVVIDTDIISSEKEFNILIQNIRDYYNAVENNEKRELCKNVSSSGLILVSFY